VALAADIALKAALVGLLVFAAARQDLPQFHGKSMTGRAIGYPLAALVVPVAWWLLSRRRPRRFPVAVDMLVVAPFVIDMAGNAANLYDTVSWWDDVNHLVNWAILVCGLGLLLRGRLSKVVVAGLAIGFGASPELKTAYHDTLGDLALGLLGSTIAAASVAWLGRRPD
jgi:hypothetical protein